jgi:hypothetical protein
MSDVPNIKAARIAAARRIASSFFFLNSQDYNGMRAYNGCAQAQAIKKALRLYGKQYGGNWAGDTGIFAIVQKWLFYSCKS